MYFSGIFSILQILHNCQGALEHIAY